MLHIDLFEEFLFEQMQFQQLFNFVLDEEICSIHWSHAQMLLKFAFFFIKTVCKIQILCLISLKTLQFEIANI